MSRDPVHDLRQEISYKIRELTDRAKEYGRIIEAYKAYPWKGDELALKLIDQQMLADNRVKDVQRRIQKLVDELEGYIETP